MISLKWFQPWTVIRRPTRGHEEERGQDVIYLTMGTAVWLPINALPDVRAPRTEDSKGGGEHAQSET